MTTKVISKLTPEQERQIPTYIQKWVDEAERPIDREVAFSCLKKLYPENLIFFTESLQNTVDLINLVRSICEVKEIKFYSQLHSQLDSQLRSQLDSQLDSQLRSQLYSQLYSQLGSQLDSQLHSQLYSQLHSQLYSQLDSQSIKWSYYVSYFWYVWAGWYEYGQYIGVKFDKEKLTEFITILRNVPLVVFVGNLIFVIEKPAILWDGNVLSNDQQPAISWKDKTGLYFLDGVHLEKSLWEQICSQTMAFEQIVAIQNADERAVALKYNKNAIITSGAELIDEHLTAGELFLIEKKEINKIVDEPRLYFLRMKCPSTGRVFVEAVEPNYAKANPYAVHCQAQAFGVSPDIYSQLRREG